MLSIMAYPEKELTKLFGSTSGARILVLLFSNCRTLITKRNHRYDPKRMDIKPKANPYLCLLIMGETGDRGRGLFFHYCLFPRYLPAACGARSVFLTSAMILWTSTMSPAIAVT